MRKITHGHFNEVAMHAPVLSGQFSRGSGWIYFSLFFAVVLVFPLLVLFVPLPDPLFPGIASFLLTGGLKCPKSKTIPLPRLSRAPPPF